jgi:hypothetical protein
VGRSNKSLLVRLISGQELKTIALKLGKGTKGLVRHKKLFSLYQSRQLNNELDKDQKTMLANNFTTSLHYYKRNLTPVKEGFALCNEKTPYKSNFDHY